MSDQAQALLPSPKRIPIESVVLPPDESNKQRSRGDYAFMHLVREHLDEYRAERRWEDAAVVYVGFPILVWQQLPQESSIHDPETAASNPTFFGSGYELYEGRPIYEAYKNSPMKLVRAHVIPAGVGGNFNPSLTLRRYYESLLEVWAQLAKTPIETWFSDELRSAYAKGDQEKERASLFDGLALHFVISEALSGINSKSARQKEHARLTTRLAELLACKKKEARALMNGKSI